MPLADRLGAMLETLSTADLEAMVPAERRRFADVCRRLAELCDRVDSPGANAGVGVLARLRDGQRGE